MYIYMCVCVRIPLYTHCCCLFNSYYISSLLYFFYQTFVYTHVIWLHVAMCIT
jgi:hypothetical protein